MRAPLKMEYEWGEVGFGLCTFLFFFSGLGGCGMESHFGEVLSKNWKRELEEVFFPISPPGDALLHFPVALADRVGEGGDANCCIFYFGGRCISCFPCCFQEFGRWGRCKLWHVFSIRPTSPFLNSFFF